MRNIFQSVCDLIVPPDASAKEVRINHMGVINNQSSEQYLFTECVNSCAGLAMISDDGATGAMAHLYSSNEHYASGQRAIELHAKKAWSRFEKTLPDGATFKAVGFGGRTDILAEYTTPLLMEEITKSSKWLGDAFYASAMASGRISDMTDFRYQNVALDAALDLKNGKVILDPHSGELTEKLKDKTPLNPGSGKSYFDYSDTASIIHRGWNIA